jgi:hypothetical protein
LAKSVGENNVCELFAESFRHGGPSLKNSGAHVKGTNWSSDAFCNCSAEKIKCGAGVLRFFELGVGRHGLSVIFDVGLGGFSCMVHGVFVVTAS